MKHAASFRAQELSDDTFELDLETASDWSDDKGETIALAYQTNVELFHYARFVDGKCVRELQFTMDKGKQAEPWEADVIAKALAQADKDSRGGLEELLARKRLVAGGSLPRNNAQDTAEEIMKRCELRVVP